MPTTLVICNDLIFSTKITGTAKALGRAAKLAPNGASVECGDDIDCVIVDLAAPGTDRPNLERIVALMNPGTEVIAFGSHVDVAKLRDAQEAGCTQVMPRSRFVELLPSLFG